MFIIYYSYVLYYLKQFLNLNIFLSYSSCPPNLFRFSFPPYQPNLKLFLKKTRENTTQQNQDITQEEKKTNQIKAHTQKFF